MVTYMDKLVGKIVAKVEELMEAVDNFIPIPVRLDRKSVV